MLFLSAIVVLFCTIDFELIDFAVACNLFRQRYSVQQKVLTTNLQRSDKHIYKQTAWSFFFAALISGPRGLLLLWTFFNLHKKSCCFVPILFCSQQFANVCLFFLGNVTKDDELSLSHVRCR